MTKLVGILNVTPDSFSDGGAYFNPDDAVKHARELFDSGAHIVDVGAESTKPLATPLTDREEWRRLEPVLKILIKEYPGKISIDTYHPKVAERALQFGPVIVNDVTGMNNTQMVDVVARLKPSVIISHLPNMPIQKAHQLTPVSNIEEVKRSLLTRAKLLMTKGLTPEKIILDPGIGFGKTMELNRKLLRFAEQMPDFDVMVGYSRKRFLGEDRMELGPNLKAGRVAALSGATYLRVHDVAGHQQLLMEL